MHIVIWILITIGLFYGYRYAYQRYLDTFLYKENQEEVNRGSKLPTLRQCMIGWLVFSFVALLLLNGSNQRIHYELCNVVYSETESNVSFLDEEGYQEGWKFFQKQAKEQEQLNVGHKRLADGIELIASQNQEGLIFVAIRIEREIQENEHYVISIQDAYRGDESLYVLKNTGLLGIYTLQQESSKNCEGFTLDIHIYNMSEKENATPVNILERFQIDKAVSYQ